MASVGNITIQITYSLRETEPTGEQCCACGGGCYLNEFKVFGLFKSVSMKPAVIDLDTRLCGSCADASGIAVGELE